jgi:hypothetical protein
MFADPQTVTINAVAQSMPRTSSGVNAGVFTTNDGLVKLSVSHQYGKKNGRLIRLDHRKVAADPLLSGVNNEYSMEVHLVVTTPKVGYTVTEAKQVVDGFLAALTASSGSKITQLLGGEN